LTFDEGGLGHYGTVAARARKSDEGGDEMDEKGSQDRALPHGSKKLKTLGIAGKLSNSPRTTKMVTKSKLKAKALQLSY